MASGTNPRAVRIASLIQRVIASSLETHMHDKRLDGVTITEVRVTNDMQIAKVYWTQIGRPGHEEGERKRAQQALRQATGRLRSLVGAKAGLRLTPTLRFIYDDVPTQATEIEDVLTVAQKRDKELEEARANAQYAGDADPYRHDDDEAEEAESEAGDSGETAGSEDSSNSGRFDNIAAFNSGDPNDSAALNSLNDAGEGEIPQA
ncbi:hypothetical protein KIMH_12340 [Bombiscardovia apis]|uniref:Ribosome-binding factor A n=1 Tax=Bombiscardovia apis TaxID=2932182 RepID=A0ABN6SJ77_9BIFI|nr:30S ribosome-binding factor RbfA [Bombiscardovia apis]BDR55123.1 hypothetical protein KIMH_12340 [Bombiscardovia apis]